MANWLATKKKRILEKSYAELLNEKKTHPFLHDIFKNPKPILPTTVGYVRV